LLSMRSQKSNRTKDDGNEQNRSHRGFHREDGPGEGWLASISFTFSSYSG
jgi:hypothetical protein